MREAGNAVGRIYNKSRKKLLADSFELADTFSSRARGLMFRSKAGKPLLFVFNGGGARGRAASAIHSLFVFFPFSAIFVDGKKRVVDVRNGSPFISFIVPKKDCAYLIEGRPELAGQVREGDVLEF